MPYLGISVAVLVAALFIAFSGDIVIERTGTSLPNATSSLSVLPSLTFPAPTVPVIVPESAIASATPAIAVPAPKKKEAPPPALSATETSVSLPAPTAPPPAEETPALLDAAAAVLRAALVNIICYAPAASGVHSISGSGVIIDSKGAILTNAHIAQYFLLADRGISCVIRSGSPATDRFKAALMFLPSAWVQTNANILAQANPSGTGEYDYALLGITESTTGAALPASFPYIPLATMPPSAGTPVVIASYGAQFLEASQIQSSLFPTVVFGSVKQVFTFALNTIDVIALGGSAAAQEGSSGGGVANASGKLIGTITTSTVEGTTDTRELDAITASYIRANYASETGEALDLLLSRSPRQAAADFAPKIPALEAILTAGLN